MIPNRFFIQYEAHSPSNVLKLPLLQARILILKIEANRPTQRLALVISRYFMRKVYSILIFMICCNDLSKSANTEVAGLTVVPIDIEYILDRLNKEELIASFSQAYNISTPYLHEYGIDAESTGILLSKESNPIFFAWTKWDSDSLFEIQVLSEEVTLKPNIRVGMTVKEFIEHYPDSRINLEVVDESSEYFVLEDRYEYTIEFLTRLADRIGRYSMGQYETEEIMNTEAKANKISVRRITNG